MARLVFASRTGSADSHKTMTVPSGSPALLTAETLCQAALHSSEVGEGTDIEPTPHPAHGIGWYLPSACLASCSLVGATTPCPGPPGPKPPGWAPGFSGGGRGVCVLIAERSFARLAHAESASSFRACDSVRAGDGACTCGVVIESSEQAVL